MGRISKLTEKTAEVKSSDGIQLGDVELIVGNEIVMGCYIGERARFILPEDMIDKIRRKTVYLNLTKEEFEDWWKKEGPLHAAEFPAKLEVILGRKLIGEDLALLEEQIKTAFNKNFPSDLPDKERERIFLEQEEIRQSFSSNVRKMLHKDEWVYYLLDLYERRPLYLPLEEDVFLITSKRLIRLKSDGTHEDNWIIPIDRITETRTYKVRRRRLPVYGGGKHQTRRYKVINFRYRTNSSLQHRELLMPVGRSWYHSPRKAKRVEKCIEEFIGLPVIEGKLVGNIPMLVLLYFFIFVIMFAFILFAISL